MGNAAGRIAARAGAIVLAPVGWLAGVLDPPLRLLQKAGGQAGMAAHVYVANADMTDDHFFNADGEMLVVPQQGALRLVTEMGVIGAGPGEICVLPRGLVFRVELTDGPVRGYVCENYGAKFTMPERGPIGANCLANPRDFKTPVARFEDSERPCRMIVKWCGRFHAAELGHSPLDVVAWHGNYAPYKYDLSTFSPVGAILFDHPDPSIFTVLTSPSGEAAMSTNPATSPSPSRSSERARPLEGKRRRHLHPPRSAGLRAPSAPRSI